MPSSAVLTFTDLDVYHAALRDVQAQGVVTAGGQFRAELTRVDFDRLSVHRGEETLPRVVDSRGRPQALLDYLRGNSDTTACFY